jgi:N-acetylglucosaminyldiphosphoundecaprenol N-acetyl-beta-D-mannosaminyltransferase
MKTSDKCEWMLGLPLSTASLDDVAERIAGWVGDDGPPRYFVCMNPHSFECARRDPAFMAAASEADLLVPDGIGVVLASKFRGGAIRDRVCGPDIFMAVTRRLNALGGRSVFFLGGRQDTLDRVIERHRRDFPDIRIAGSLAPPYKPTFDAADNEAMAKVVNESGADVLWVGLGSPKQERWSHDIRPLVSARLIGPIGAMFDFYAGTMPMAPRWVQAAGLQWLYRLVKEPRRLWRRNIDGPLFAVRALLEPRSATQRREQAT